MPSINPDVWALSPLDMTVRILLAVALGGFIGFEREWTNHAAGLRTHILVCVGASLIMLLSIYGFSDFAYEVNVRVDPARLAAQVISGIGFLGAGAIIRNGLTISGLTTAASIWVVAGIGLAVGAGFIYPAVLVTVLVLMSLFLLNKLERTLMRNHKQHELSLTIDGAPGRMADVLRALEQHGLTIKRMHAQAERGGEFAEAESKRNNIKLSVAGIDWAHWAEFVHRLSMMEGVVSVEVGYVKNLLRPANADTYKGTSYD